MKNNNIFTMFSFKDTFSIIELFTKKKIISIIMFFSGVILLYLVGFAQGSGNLVHNVAHDTRHATGFPCH